VFENRVLRRIFGPKIGEGRGGGWNKIRNEELNDLSCSPSFVRVIKSRRMRWLFCHEKYEHVICGMIYFACHRLLFCIAPLQFSIEFAAQFLSSVFFVLLMTQLFHFVEHIL
jgi:hypothetical protein